MKKIILIILALFISLQAKAYDPKIDELAKEKLPAIEEPDIHIKTLDNGIKIYYMQSRELPIFKISSFFKVGILNEKYEERGFTNFFLSSWRNGGTDKLSSHDVDERLEFLASRISAGTAMELTHFKMVTLMQNLKESFDIYVDLLRKPGFEEDRMEIIRKNILNGIKRRNENPMGIATREFKQGLFGEKSPYAWMSSPDTIGKMSRDQFQQFYKSAVTPKRMYIAATSPLDFDEFLKLIKDKLGDWKNEVPELDVPKKLKKEWEKSTSFIQKEGNQSSILIGHFGERRFNKDKYKMILANEMLGGATFGSKLGNRIRTELGLAYSVSSIFDFSSDYGIFAMVTQTKSESTVQTIQEMVKILKNMVIGKTFTEEELKLAKERILNRLVFEYSDPFHIVQSRLSYDYHGYPPGYLKIYQKEIEKVKLEDIKAVIGKYMQPEKLKIMLVGDKSKIKDLDKLDGLKELPLDWE